MRNADERFIGYGETHRNRANKLIRQLCMPAIMFCFVGLPWLLSASATAGTEPMLKMTSIKHFGEPPTIYGPPLFLEYFSDGRILYALNDELKVYDKEGAVVAIADLEDMRPVVQFARTHAELVYVVTFYSSHPLGYKAFLSEGAYSKERSSRHVGIWNSTTGEWLYGSYIDGEGHYDVTDLGVSEDGTVYILVPDQSAYATSCVLYRMAGDLSTFEEVFRVSVDEFNGESCDGLALNDKEPGDVWIHGGMRNVQSLQNPKVVGEPEDISAFAIRLEGSTGTVRQSLIIGGKSSAWITEMAFSPEGNAVMLGTTWSENLPTSDHAFQQSTPGERSMFVATADGAGDVAALTYLGSSYLESAAHLTVGADGSIYAFGNTYSMDFPTTENAFLEIPADHGGSELGLEATLSVLNAGLEELKYSTYIAGAHTGSGSPPGFEVFDARVMDGGVVELLGSTSASLFAGLPDVDPEALLNDPRYYSIRFESDAPWIDQAPYLTPLQWSKPYSHQLEARGGTPPYTWRLRPEYMHTGIDFSDHGLLQGTYHHHLDENEKSRRLLVNMELTDAHGKRSIKAVHLPSIHPVGIYDRNSGFPLPTDNYYRLSVGENFELELGASSGWGPFTWQASGTIPPGLQARTTEDGSVLLLTGKLDEAGDWHMTLTLVDSLGDEAVVNLRVEAKAQDVGPPTTGGGGGGGNGLGLLVLGLLLLFPQSVRIRRSGERS